MKFLLDESVEYRLAAFLTDLGHDVTAIARQEDRIVITNDKDFGELVFRQRLVHRGVILLRIKDDRIEAKQAGLLQALQLSPDQLRGFVAISDRGIRVRPAPAENRLLRNIRIGISKSYGRPNLWLQHPRPARRAATRPNYRRAGDADLSDDQLRV